MLCVADDESRNLVHHQNIVNKCQNVRAANGTGAQSVCLHIEAHERCRTSSSASYFSSFPLTTCVDACIVCVRVRVGVGGVPILLIL